MKRLLLILTFSLIVYLPSNGHLEEMKQPVDSDSSSLQVTMAKNNRMFYLEKNPADRTKNNQRIPLPIDQLPQDLLYTLDELQASNSHNFQREVRHWIRWLNPLIYIPESQEKCETHLDFLFIILLEDHIEDVQSRPDISSQDAQAIESTFRELYSITIPTPQDEEYLLEIHKPFKYPLYALLFSLLESKVLSLKAYHPSSREKRAHFFDSMFRQTLHHVHTYCKETDIQLSEEIDQAIEDDLAFILPTALKAIKYNHCNAYQGGLSWWSYLHDSFQAISPYLNLAIKGLIVGGLVYLLLEQDRNMQQQLIAFAQQQNQQALINAFAAMQNNSLKVVATLIPAALPYLFGSDDSPPPRRVTSSYGYSNTSRVHSQRPPSRQTWIS